MDVASCTCGFFDSRTNAVWTDAIITYANETRKLPADSLLAEDFQHDNEKNWNARYRAGASSANIGHNDSTAPGWNGSAWTLHLDRPTRDHAVVGASIRSLRRDMHYGTFEAALGPPKPGVGGSVLAMRLDYNETQTLSANVMNADDPKDAWTSFMIYGDWRGTRSKGVNFTNFGNSTYNFLSSPWGFVTYRIDWTAQKADFFIGDALARTVSARDTSKGWPTTPSTLYIRHSSTGDTYTSEGPPPNGSFAHVGMIRAFFNSSLMSAADHASFDARCGIGSSVRDGRGPQQQCLVTDTMLRGSTPFLHTATLRFKARPTDYKKRWPAIFVASICITISTVLLAHALVKRAPWTTKALAPAALGKADGRRHTAQDLSITPSMIFSAHHGLIATAQLPDTSTPVAATPGAAAPGQADIPRASMLSLQSSDVTVGWSKTGTLMDSGGCLSRSNFSSASSAPAATPSATLRGDSQSGTRPGSSSLQIPQPPAGISIHWKTESDEITIVPSDKSVKRSSSEIRSSVEINPIKEKRLSEMKAKEIDASDAVVAGVKQPSSAPKQRVDHLAGLVALASVLVTLIHFCLTFLPATAIPYAHAHYKSEVWVFKIVTPYLLTFSWIGPFFTSSTRFLVMTYLKSGNLKGVAEKTVGRTPRLIIPCAAVAALEYFCMQVGAINWLEHLPSVTWSTWPYTSNYITFGHFISEIIKLMYIIPNAVPQITFHYCIGVLWTIPIQLQNSWTCLLAVIVIRKIKTPWKRMAYYFFCILMHWYAMSWGSFFWVGLLIADLDITYKWKTWLYARPHVYYPVITFIVILAIGSPTLDLIGQWSTINFNKLEYGVHPHQQTGHTIRETVEYGYPAYYLPRLTALTFSIGFHLLVELSPLVQKFFSNHLFLWLFPHILTLYLIHGLIFWSLGAVICIKLAAHGVPYWANMLVVAVCTYTVIFGCLPFLTPIIDTLGKSITMSIWRDASEKPAERRKTLYPFGPELLKDGIRNDTQIVQRSDDVEKNRSAEVCNAL